MSGAMRGEIRIFVRRTDCADPPPMFSTERLLRRLERLPMVKLLLPFVAGILLAGPFTLPLWFTAGAFVLCGAVALLLRAVPALGAMLLTAGFAAAQLHERPVTVPRGVVTLWELDVAEAPADRGRYTVADAGVRAWRDPASGRWHAVRERVRLYADSALWLGGGERLVCRAALRDFRGGAASYRRLMHRRGYAGTLWVGPATLLDAAPVPAPDLHLRASACLGRLPLRGEASAVVRAMAAGDRSGITAELRTAYSRSGFSHLLAVSGLHTGMLFALVNLLLVWMPLLRGGHLLRSLAVIAAVWCFVAAAGFPPSAVRAAVMCTLLQAALVASSAYVALNALAAAAFGMLLWNPAWIGDISFSLSFLAVAGILVWGVPLCRRLHIRRRAVRLVAEAYLIGLSATVATAPLVAHTFGLVPLAGVLLNPVAILLATVVVFGGVVWMLLPAAWLAPIAALPVGAAAEGINALARWVAAMPRGVAEATLGTGWTAAVYLLYLLVTLLAWSYEPKKRLFLFRQ